MNNFKFSNGEMNKILFTIWILNVFNKKSLRGNFSFLLCILTQDYAVNKSVFLLFLDLLQLHGKCRLRINEQWRNEIRKWCHLFVVLETNVGSGDVIYGFHCPTVRRRHLRTYEFFTISPLLKEFFRSFIRS